MARSISDLWENAMTHHASTGRRITGWRIGIGAVLLALLAGCGSTPPLGGPAQSPLQRDLVTDVSGAGALPHLEALQRIADENDGNRASPGPGYDASVDYVAGVLRSAGFDVSTPTFTVRGGRRGGGGEATVRNVVAQTRTGDPTHVVMAGAHLDSVPEGPGINDNGSGVASLLEIATRLGDSPPVENAVRFAFWGSEEADLDGSTNYVKSLSTADRSRIMLYLNLDMVASPNPGYFVQGGEGRRARQTGPAGSAEVAKVLVDQLAATGVAAETTTFDAESDYEAFVEAGIPSGGVLAGDSNEKSQEQVAKWGGQAGRAFDECYHSDCDGIDNLDRTALDRNTDAIAGTVAHFATSAQRPTT
jgi:aminopeptidase S